VAIRNRSTTWLLSLSLLSVSCAILAASCEAPPDGAQIEVTRGALKSASQSFSWSSTRR